MLVVCKEAKKVLWFSYQQVEIDGFLLLSCHAFKVVLWMEHITQTDMKVKFWQHFRGTVLLSDFSWERDTEFSRYIDQGWRKMVSSDRLKIKCLMAYSWQQNTKQDDDCMCCCLFNKVDNPSLFESHKPCKYHCECTCRWNSLNLKNILFEFCCPRDDRKGDMLLFQEFEMTDQGRRCHRRLNWVSYSVRTVYKWVGKALLDAAIVVLHDCQGG